MCSSDLFPSHDTIAIRAILIGNSGLKRIRFANADPEAIEDMNLLGMAFANINAAQIDDYSIVSVSFANIDPPAMNDPPGAFEYPPLPYPILDWNWNNSTISIQTENLVIYTSQCTRSTPIIKYIHYPASASWPIVFQHYATNFNLEVNGVPTSQNVSNPIKTFDSAEYIIRISVEITPVELIKLDWQVI